MSQAENWKAMVSARDFCSMCENPYSYDHPSNAPAVRTCGHYHCSDCTSNSSECGICGEKSVDARIIAPNNLKERNRAKVIRALWMLSKDEEERAIVKRKLVSELQHMTSLPDGSKPLPSPAAKRQYSRVLLVCNRAASLLAEGKVAIPSSPAAIGALSSSDQIGENRNASTPINEKSYAERCEGLIDAPEEEDVSYIDHESSGLFDRAYTKRQNNM
ncbi:unnamed protein product [Oikopleura dioica]|uniref:RING-type domain-containing protein n=1 Tax=Oikopleura dioica TaxID=34765 RepID=E4YBJ4_OIKDI|nr:unnamed protein product [Oikopleura dioica]